ncbi:MAG: alpha/beta hydrolase [Chloroflexi bacterium]|nr:MAG: alpha/beta hydrolase [Chloroflexota bacterium]
MNNKRAFLKPWGKITITLVGLTGIILGLSIPGYLENLKQARNRQKKLGSEVLDTACGPIEYATVGEGEPVLFVHGVVGGYDQGIITSQVFLGEKFRIIAPSRFGYQHTLLPVDASPAAQADAHACLLDALQISKVSVVGISAGVPSTLQFALRHPERVSRLVLIVPLAYTPQPAMDSQSIAFPFILSSILKLDYPIWVAMKLNPQLVLSTMGVPKQIQGQLTKEKQVETMNMLLPFNTRIPGTMNDGKIANNMEPYPIRQISVPTLVISAKDDLWKTYPAAQYTASNIPEAKFIGFNTGGHMLNGQEEKVRQEITQFLRKDMSR